MKLSKRMLAVLCTLLMLASCFALPYGALAAEDVAEDAVADNIGGKVVATIQKDETTAKQGGDQWVGKSFTLAEPFAYGEGKSAKDYMITLEVKIHQDYGFTDPAWIFKCLGGGNMIIRGKNADGGDTSKTNPITYISMLQNAGVNAEDKWFLACIPLSSLTGVSFTKLEFNTYVHACEWDPVNFPKDNSKCKNGCSISYRNVVVRDMSRTADGGPNKNVVAFGRPEQVFTQNSADGNHTPSNVNINGVMYNLATSDMDLSKLTLEFDIKYTSTNPDFDANKIVNGRIRMGGGETKGTWSNGKTPAKDTWYHIAVPLTEFNNLTDASAINSIFAFNYNDGGAGTNPGFTTHAKNIVITHNDVTALEEALEDAKAFIYDVDENATAYETALNNARALFTSETATYADFATALTALNAAKANVTNGRDMVYEVARYTAHEYAQGTTLNANNTQIYYDWRGWDGYTNTGVDLRDDLNGDITKIGANRYFQTTVTFTPNPNWTGTPLESLDILNRLEIRVRTNDGSEKRTNSYTLQTVNKTVTADKVVYEMELLLDDSQRYQAEWDDIRQSIIFPYITVNSDANKVTPVICTLSNVRIVNKTAEAIEADLKEAAEGYIAPGKYTAESTAEYLTYKEQAQAMLEDDGATLQEKTQLIAKINAAKDKFVSIVTEYVQFGAPDVESVKTNTGINGQHGLGNNTIVVNKKTLTGTEDISKLQLRIEYFISRDDGQPVVQNAVVNGNVKIQGGTDMQYNFSALFPGAVGDEWGTAYIDLSSFSNASVENLMNATQLVWFGYNDLRNLTSNPGVTIKLRNVAIIDNTNVSAVEDMKNLFADVTKGGTVDFTPDSYAAYKAVYDEWYDKAYATVDLTQYEAAKAALEEAYAKLVCVDKVVADLSGFNGDSQASKGYMAREVSFAPADLTIRNRANLVLRFTLTYTGETTGTVAPEGVVADLRDSGLSLFNEDGTKVQKYYSYQLGDNVMEIPLTQFDANGALTTINKIQLFGYAKENAGAASTQNYKFTISNAELVDTTKVTMAADLKAEAETTLDAMGQEAGCVYDDATAGDFKAAQAAALEILAKEDPTYAELADAQAAIDAGKAKLVAVGHIVASFDVTNGYSDSTNFIERNVAVANKFDLSAYNVNKLVIRMRITLSMTDGSTPANPIKVASVGYLLHSTDANKTEGQHALLYQGLQYGVNDIAIPVKNLSQNGWGSGAGSNAVDMTNIDKLRIFGYVKETIGGADQAPSSNVRMTVDNACIVDTTAEENFGSLKVVGNGRVNMTDGILYGTDNKLTATTSSEASKFVGWKKNDSFVKANEVDATLTLPVNGKQDVTAYFAAADEAVVVYTGKYNRVVDVQVVKDAAALVAPDAPAITGQTFVGWDEIGQLTMGEANIVKAIYTTDEVTEANGYTVTLSGTSNDTATTGNVYGFDKRFALTAAAAPEGQKFSHWLVNGNIAGYTDTLTVYVSGNMTIEAVYVAEDVVVEQELSASITQNQMVANGSAYNFEVIAQTYLPEDYDLMAYGVIFAPNAETLTELATTGATEGATLDVVSSSNIPNRQYKITLEKVTAGRTRSAMAYITARNADGEIVTVYSGVETKVAE